LKELKAATLQQTDGQIWFPNPGPQTDAFFSEADELFYGGAAGGGTEKAGPFVAPHVVFVLHLPAEQLAFRPVYHTTSCDWQGGALYLQT
jgi:hypothetical protein